MNDKTYKDGVFAGAIRTIGVLLLIVCVGGVAHLAAKQSNLNDFSRCLQSNHAISSADSVLNYCKYIYKGEYNDNN